MTVPTNPAAGRPSDPAASKGADDPSSQRRPAGPTGGHTVQDWEQPASRQGQPADLQPTTSVALARNVAEDPDLPSPPTVPRYLRADQPARARPPTGTPKPAFDARTQILTAQSAALVDALTRGITDALAVALQPAIAATVDQLLPMILTLGSVPDPAPEGPAAADVATAGLAAGEVKDVGEAA